MGSCSMRSSNSPSQPQFVNEGFSLDHDANMISTWHLDFRPPAERSPIGQLVKYSRAEHTVERCKTIQLARPPYFRQQGETLIHDENEAHVTNVVKREGVPLAVAQAWKQQEEDYLRSMAALMGYEVLDCNITLVDPITVDRDTLTWGADYWLYCTAMAPTSDAELRALRESLAPDYSHGTYISSARTFAQALCRAYVATYGAPDDEKEPMAHSLDGEPTGTTYHRWMLVIHGPVVYVRDPFSVCATAANSQDSRVKTLLPLFLKHQAYSGQREYRFVILDKRAPGASSKIMPVTSQLLAAFGQPEDSKGPMHIPDFHPAN